MKVVHKISEVREIVNKWKREGLSVGLVPTMGYLHEGHQSLIKKAVEENDRVFVSVFVNPMQFGENEDLASYPRDLEKDTKLCEETGANLIFNPTPEEMYPEGFCSYVDMNSLTKELCGKSRPIHFRGVMTIVSKLFNIVTPNKAYFGMKDAQQLLIIKRMVKDLSFGIEIVGCPIVREEDGPVSYTHLLGYVDDELKAVSVDGVEPSEKTVSDGSYKVQRPFIVVTKGDASSEVKAFVEYMLSADGQGIVESSHFVKVK